MASPALCAEDTIPAERPSSLADMETATIGAVDTVEAVWVQRECPRPPISDGETGLPSHHPLVTTVCFAQGFWSSKPSTERDMKGDFKQLVTRCNSYINVEPE